MRKLALFIVFIILMSVVFAQPQFTSNNTNISLIIQQTMKRGLQSYPFSPNGTRMLVDDIKDTETELYAILNPLVLEIENKVRIATGFMIGGPLVGLGVGAIAAAVYFLAYNPNPNNDTFNANFIEMKPFISLIIVLCTTIFATSVGFIIGVLNYPTIDDLYKFVNRHNVNCKENPITVSFGKRDSLISLSFAY